MDDIKYSYGVNLYDALDIRLWDIRYENVESERVCFCVMAFPIWTFDSKASMQSAYEFFIDHCVFL